MRPIFATEVTSNARILVVDDEQANVRLLERLLASGGFSNVRATTDARTAIAVAEEFKPDLVMLDLNMPHVDGFEIMSGIRARSSPTEYLPVLVLTADMTRAAKERALSSGATDFVTKPFERVEVLLRTQNLLEARCLHLAITGENKVLGAKLVYQALHDSLTGLANRALLRERALHALTRVARGTRIAMLMIDLDDFKAVNDGLGHGEGDHLLKAVSERLTQATRGCDTVARIGGDEFAILLDNIADPEDALRVVRRIYEMMKAPVALMGREVVVAVSVGVAHARPGDQVDELIRNADVAMYCAKDRGKGRHAIFEPSMYSAVLERLELASGLRHALERNEMRVLYQPIVELRTGAITGVEALARWHRPGYEVSEPSAFIPIAEETGLIVPIGRWILREACHQARRWQIASANGTVATMSVNVSARQLYDPDFATDVAAVLAETQLPPDRLTLEITESVLISNEAAEERLRELKALGVRLAIDDFGTGYSNLSYLQKFPLDIIKIDRSFVAKLAESGETALTSVIVDLASTLNLQTVAEGIEHADQRAQLISLGCVSGQGFLFARPVEAEVVGDFLSGARRLQGTAFGAAPMPA